jgi:YbbR domain-containing protein
VVGMNNWLDNKNVVRIVALLVGFLLWFIVHIDEQMNDNTQTGFQPRIETNRIYDVTVHTVGLDTQKYQLVSIDPQKVNITVQGRTADLNKVSTKDGNSRILADLSDVKPGVNRVPLQAVSFPEGVTVTAIDPAEVEVVIEAIEKKEVPVKVVVTGEPGNEFKAGEPIANPSTVYVTAPKSVLDRIVEARAAVDISGAVERVVREVILKAVDEAGEPVEATIVPSTATVNIPITVPFKTLPLQVRLVGHPPAGYSVESYTQSVSEVTVYGPEAVLNKLSVYDGLEINLSLLTSSKTYTFTIPLKDQIEQVYPSSIDVQITIVKSATRTFRDVPIRLIGTNDNYESVVVEPAQGTVDIVVEGAPANLDGLEPDDVEAVVDVSNLPLGTHVRDLTVNLPIFMKVGSETPQTVTVEIRNKAGETAGEPDEPPGESEAESAGGSADGEPDAGHGANGETPPGDAADGVGEQAAAGAAKAAAVAASGDPAPVVRRESARG